LLGYPPQCLYIFGTLGEKKAAGLHKRARVC
jgi:hypothetical protein